jgi:hypothetical protein
MALFNVIYDPEMIVQKYTFIMAYFFVEYKRTACCPCTLSSLMAVTYGLLKLRMWYEDRS